MATKRKWSVSAKRASKLVKKGKAVKTGKNQIGKYTRKTKKNPDAWVATSDLKTKTVRASAEEKKKAKAKKKVIKRMQKTSDKGSKSTTTQWKKEKPKKVMKKKFKASEKAGETKDTKKKPGQGVKTKKRYGR